MSEQQFAGYSQPNAGFFPYGNQLSLPSASIGIFPVVKLRGLPYSATVEDIMMFFSGLDVLDVFLPGETGRASQGDGYVVFSSALYLQFALQRNGQRMGKRWIEVYKTSRLAYCEAVVNSAHNASGGVGGVGVAIPQANHASPSPSPSHPSQDQTPGNSLFGFPQNQAAIEAKKEEVQTEYLKLLGLPFSATIQDIINFFSGYGLIENSIQIVKNAEGKPTGTAFVQFTSIDDARSAICKHRDNIGSRYIELFGSSREQAESELNQMAKMHVPRGNLGYVPRPGDWTCPEEKCGTNNFGSRHQCFRCGTPRPK